MDKSNLKFTVLYARLSQEDTRNGESLSIENQRQILETYATENGFENLKFLADDGVSGTTYNRPAWKKVMELIESNQVANLVVKDSSRLGRDYLQTGHLMENVFPAYGVRFVSISDNMDSLYGLDDFTPFRNIMHEHYAKDTSKKIKTVKKAKALRGERIGAKPPYGFKKDEENPTKIKPDPQSALVVKKIFALCIAGRGPKQIAKQLEAEEIPNPTNYHFQKTGVELLNLNTEKPWYWSHKTVGRIIEDDVYLGHTTSMKVAVISYKNHKKINRPKEDWVRVENTHEPIISEEDFKMAQSVRKHKKRPPNDSSLPNPFSGLLICSDCHKVLTVQRYQTMQGKRSTFRCSTNRTQTDDCPTHSIRESQLIKIVLDDLKRVTHFARMNETLFAEYIQQKTSSETRAAITAMEREIAKAEKRELELTKLFKKLYEDNVSVRLSDETFQMLSSEYQEEQKAVKAEIPQKQDRLEQLRKTIKNADAFINRAKEYTEIEELTSEVLRTFIDKIVVGDKGKKYDYTSIQDVWIYYRDIGLLDASENGT